MWMAVLVRGLAVYLVAERKQPLSPGSSSKGAEDGLLPRRDGTAHQILQVAAAAPRERIYSPLELPSYLPDPREQTSSNLRTFFSCQALILIDAFMDATCSLVVRPLDTK